MTHIQIKIYNEFVNAMNGILIESMKVKSDGVGLFFSIETSNGWSDEFAKKTFKHFLKKYPFCGIDYNLQYKPTVFESELYKVSETVIELSKGFYLSKIK